MEQAVIANLVFLWILVLINLLLTFAIVRRLRVGGSGVGSLVGLPLQEPAPDFQAETLDNQVKRLSDFAGQKTAFVFISAGCQPCIEAIPELEAAYEGAKESGTDIIYVSSSDPTSTRQMVQDHGISAPILVAPRDENPFLDDYQAQGTPFYCIINEEGLVHETGFFTPQWKKKLEEWQLTVSPTPVAS